MFNFVGGLTISNSAKFIADVFSVIFGIFGRTIANSILNAIGAIVNFITSILWIVAKWFLGIIDAMQFGFTRLLGIDTSTQTSLSVGEIIQGAKDITVSGGSNYYDYIMKIFRATFAVAIILMIVFTIVAMVMQEYKLAMNGYAKADNKKGKFVKIILSNILTIFLMPLIFYTIIAGASSILTSFYRALGTTTDVTIAGNVLASATYDANRYRAYANADKRIPITISVYSMENSFGVTRSDDELKEAILDHDTQEKLKAIGGAFANDSFLPFEKSTIYNGGTWSNYENYSLKYNNTVYDDLGDYFENFICTREQYYVMADFIDYCQLYDVKYYIKAMSEPDICWKYVEGLEVDADIDEKGNALGDITLNVQYRDASIVNMENTNGDDDEKETYDLQITTKIDYTSPISDALTTASKLLGIDETNSKFNTMERDDSGDYTNLVSWSTEKVLLKTSDDFELNDDSTWTFSDQIIVYEYFRFQAEGTSSNNVFQDYTLNESKNDFENGVTLDAMKMTYRNYNSNTGSYSDEKTQECVKINNTYYKVYASDKEFDEYGHPYYMLTVEDVNSPYFKEETITIQKMGSVDIKLSSGFDINKPRLGESNGWTTQDQIIVYEYFKNLSLSNEIVKNYKFIDFYDGVEFDYYKIGSSYYVYINGTYYQCSSSGLISGSNFLKNISDGETKYFGYEISVQDKKQYGIDKLSDIYETNVGDFVDIDDTDAKYQRYTSMNFKLSEDFSFFNPETWTFRDYSLIYLYIKQLNQNPAISIDSLKALGVQGTYGRDGGTYYLQVKLGTSSFVYVDLENLSKTSELKITQTLASTIFDDMNLGLAGVNLVTSYNATSDRLISLSNASSISSHKFELSEKFNAYDADTWTVGDFLLIYLTEEGVLDTNLDLLKVDGYTSLIYKADSKYYYRFGKEKDENAFFLDASRIEQENYTIEKWFNTNLMAFLIKESYNLGIGDLVYDENNFGGGAYVNKDNFIFSLGMDITNSKSLQYVLAKEIFDSGVASTDVSMLEYSYANPEVNPNDPTTWKYIDLMIFQQTGSIPTISSPYKSKIYYWIGSYWFLIKNPVDSEKDIFVNLSGNKGCFVYDSKILYNQIHSNNKESFGTFTEFNTYYNDYFSSSVRTIAPTGSDCKVYYYSEYLKGSEDTATFEANKLMTDLDIILIKNQVSKTTLGYYVFEGKLQGDNVYVKIKDITSTDNDVYISLTTDKSDKIYFEKNSIVPKPGSSNMFELVTGETYTSFKLEGHNQFDALLYSLVGSTSSVTYDIYKSTLDATAEYIIVNDRFVKLDNDLVSGTLIDLSTTQSRYVEFLYENYYSSHASKISPVVSERYSISNLSYTSYWYTAVNVISRHFDLISDGANLSTDTSITKELILSSSGDYYLYLFKKVDNETNEIYINLTGIATHLIESTSTVGKYKLNLTSTDADLAKWRLLNTYTETVGLDTVIKTRLPEYLENSLDLRETTTTKSSKDVDTIKDGTTGEVLTDNKVIDVRLADTTSSGGICVADGMPLDQGDFIKNHLINDFTFANLLSVYFDPKRNYETLNIYYTLDGEKYVIFQGFGEQYVVPFELFFTFGSSSANDYKPELTDSVFGGSSDKSIFNHSITTGTTLDGTIIGSMFDQHDYKDVYLKFVSYYFRDDNGDPIEVYIAESIETGETFAIYGLKNESIGASGIGYLIIDDSSDDTTTVLGTVSALEDAEIFVLKTKNINNVSNWSMLDYVISYVTQTNHGLYIGSEVYCYAGKYYILNDGNYILIPKLTSENIFGNDGDNQGLILSSESTKLIDLLGSYVFKRGGSSVSSDLTSFETDKLKQVTSGRDTHIKFSENFDIRDTSTWTIADYILYYVTVNDFYEDGTSLKIPFTYIPNYVINEGNSVSNVSYLDLFIANSCDSYSDYFNNSNQNKAQNLYIVYDDSYNYYVEIKSNYFVKLSDYLYTNYSKMELCSPILGDVFSLEVAKGSDEDKIGKKLTEIANFVETSISNKKDFKTSIDNKNFQTLANSHGTLGFVHYLLKQDENTGSVAFDKVIEFNSDSGEAGTYFKYNKFFELYGSSFASYATTVNENQLDISIYSNAKNNTTTEYLEMEINYSESFPDLTFKNYYYFIEDATKLQTSQLFSVGSNVQDAIREGSTEAFEKTKLSLKLSTVFVDGERVSGFDIESTSTWTVIDYIIMREFSREGLNHNKFRDMSFDELYENTYANLYKDGEDDTTANFYLYINGNYYNLKGYIEFDNTLGVYVSNGTKIDDAISGVITKNNASINNFSFRTLKETLEFAINSSFNRVQYNRDKDNISYTIGDVIHFKYIDTDTAYGNYRIKVSSYAKYSAETMIKKSSWVEKLMTDMQVYYPTLNWGTLIATDGWLDTLGDFTSAYTNGLFTGGNNSSNTTAAGLVLSEFFMSVASKKEGGYAEYEYSSVFDEDTIKSLMLSLMGEENYQALVFEAEVFMDFFNTTYAPIIDDFAKEFGESVEENSLRLCAYKSYLATLLLSSDIGEYLYTVATRIYAEYTIGEYLANAGDDYTGYYSYANNLEDENGELVDSYNYGTFKELVRYENQYCGKNNPTFTFNVEKAFKRYAKLDDDANENTLNGTSYDTAISNDFEYEEMVGALLACMDEEYKDIYDMGYEISEQGKVIDSDMNVVPSYSDETFVFCYMLHVYWSIKSDITSPLEPTYLQSYRDYLDGNLTRWAIFSDTGIDGAEQYYESETSIRLSLGLYKTLSFANIVRLYLPAVVLGDNDEEGFLGKLKSLCEVYGDILDNPKAGLQENTVIAVKNTYDMFEGNGQAIKALEFIMDNSLSLFFTMGYSEDSKYEIIDAIKELISGEVYLSTNAVKCWNTILKFNDNLDVVISELKAVRHTLPGDKTEGGSNRAFNNSTTKFYSDEQIDKILSYFQDLKYNVMQYISSQEILDKMQKRSITFTLAQYGANYISSGYEFTVRKKDYTFRSNVDPSRIAEYVYGGAFLESVGVGAQYTASDFTGIVQASKVYDVDYDLNYIYDEEEDEGKIDISYNKVLKTNLITWPKLRTFASNIADKTAELYFLTNLGDLDIGKVNAVKVDTPLKNGTIASEIASFIKEQFTANFKKSYGDNTEGANAATSLIKRILGLSSQDNISSVDTMTQYKKLSLYLFSNEVEEEELEGISFEDYKRIALKKIIENQRNEDETAEERANRYMTLFNLLGLQYDLCEVDNYNNVVQHLDRVIYKSQLDKIGASKICYIERMSNSTIDIVKSMSGLENRPTIEVLTREYSGTRTGDYFDESYGDTFIICSYKDGLYYPILASGSKIYSSDEYDDFYNEENPDEGILKHKFISEYLGSESYVIVAKGIITADGNPTAIRKYNNPIEIEKKNFTKASTDIYNEVTFYRTNIGGSLGAGENLISSSKAINRVTTKNYTKYVYGTNYTQGIGETMTYTGRNNLKTLIRTDVESNFVQTNVEYLISDADTFGAISVLDEFSYFYLLGMQSWTMLLLGFITIIPVMINALGGVASRIFDLIILFVISPLIISTNSLYVDGKNDIYKRWRKNVETVLWSALGYVVGFSSFSLFIPLIYNINVFVDVGTFNSIVSLGGIKNIITYPTVNSLVRYLWVVTAVTLLDKLPKLMLPILTANKGDLTSPDPGLATAGTTFTEKVKKNLVDDVKDVAQKVGSVVSGRALVGAIHEIKDEVIDMIPGSEIFKSGKKKVDGWRHKIEQRQVEKMLVKYGYSKKEAKAVSDAMEKSRQQQEKIKANKKKRIEEYKKQFKNLI